jgi:hypothetical protein
MRIVGQCGVGANPPQEVLVVDLTPSGCRLLGISAGISRTEPMTLWFGTLGPITATLKWAKKGSVGVAFDSPLDLLVPNDAS